MKMNAIMYKNIKEWIESIQNKNSVSPFVITVKRTKTSFTKQYRTKMFKNTNKT